MHSKKVLNKTLYHLFVVLFGFVMVYPVLWMVSGSFKGNAEILRGTLALIPNELKLDNSATGWKGFGGTTFGTFFKKHTGLSPKHYRNWEEGMNRDFILYL